MKKILIAVATATALIPAVADAKLGGAPTLTKIDSTSASLRFAADKAPSKITFANGAKVGTIKKIGKHGSDNVYRVRVTSDRALRDGVKYTVTFKSTGETAQKR